MYFIDQFQEEFLLSTAVNSGCKSAVCKMKFSYFSLFV